MNKTLLQWTTGLIGAINTVVGLLLILAPRWFFETIAPFPPYNRHFEGDAGAFLLALGIGFVFAARDPFKNRLMIGIGALGLSVHVLNHLADVLMGTERHTDALTDLAPNVVITLITLVVFVVVIRQKATQEGTS